MTETRPGLKGVVAAETKLSSIDGEEGVLRYRGYDIRDLAENASFEETAYLLWQGELPSERELAAFRGELAKDRALEPQVLDVLRKLGGDASPMATLRTGASVLGQFDPEADAGGEEANARKARRLLAKLPTLIAAYHRLREGHEPVDPDQNLGHAANFVQMLTGDDPTDRAAEAMDTALVLHADHGLNASTFTARVVASTLSDMYSAVTAAIGALKGPLHGGANQAVMEMLEEIQDPDEVDAYVQGKLDEGERIMGFGHRVYRTMDPRATILKRYSRELGEETGETRWYDMSTRIQETMQTAKGLDPNVDFYSASTYHSLGIPKDLFTPIFALSRTAGWCAHIMEQAEANSLIRPRGKYVGPEPRAWDGS